MLGLVLRRMSVLLLDDFATGVMGGFRDKGMGRIGLAFFQKRYLCFFLFFFTSFIKLL